MGAGEVLYAGATDGARVLRSDDAGASWTSFDVISTDDDSRSVEHVAVGPAGTVYVFSKPYLYRSEDKGTTWVQTTSDSLQVWQLLINKSGHIFYYDHAEGVRVSRDQGATWTTILDPLPTYSDLALDAAGFLYATTDGQGVWRSSTSTHVANEQVAEVPRHIALGQNYPNPFNPRTTIPFTLSQPTRITIDVVDVLGRVVATLVAGEMPVGSHTVSWEATGVASGIYFYRLHTEHQLEVRKMALIQ